METYVVQAHVPEALRPEGRSAVYNLYGPFTEERAIEDFCASIRAVGATFVQVIPLTTPVGAAHHSSTTRP